VSDDEGPYADLIQDLHAMCEKGLRCHFHSNPSLMCVTCRAAQYLYLCARHCERLTQLHYEWLQQSLSNEMAAFHDDLVAGGYGPFPPQGGF